MQLPKITYVKTTPSGLNELLLDLSRTLSGPNQGGSTPKNRNFGVVSEFTKQRQR